MNVKRFCAPTSREALNKLRDAMGPDAVIISNRNVNGQVEILALADADMNTLHDADIPDVEQSDAPRQTISSKTEQHSSLDQSQIIQLQNRFAASKKQHDARNEPRQASPDSVTAALPVENSVPADMMSELRAMRSAMEEQMAELSWSNSQRREPLKAQLLKELLATGFSASLSRYMIDHMPRAKDHEQSLSWIKAILTKNLNANTCDSDMLESGGVFALIGPTGVGKTTTTAKLAARCVMRHGASKLALITTDGYRIGGYEQLRIYGKILGVMVHAVKDEADLRIALSELKNKHTVLIDTVGMSQRDRLVSDQIAMLSGANVKKLLCLNATSNGETLSEVIRSYQGAGLTGCIITKMDEAAHIGSVLDAIIRHKLTMFYLANGQRVPEDLHLADKQYLIDHAFKYKRSQPAYQYQDDELPILLASAGARTRPAREVSYG